MTDPPAVFNTDAVWGLIGSDYDEDLSAAFVDVMQQLDEFQRSGSGWVLDKFTELDVTIITCTSLKKVVKENDDYDNDED